MASKTAWKYFSIFDYEKEQDYLRQMHRDGWRLTHITGLGAYHFESCAPEDVVYRLDYNEDSRTQHDTYVQLFRDCGWDYVQDFFGYSYFRKPAADCDGHEDIFCDDASRLQMMERVFKARLRPLLVLFFALILPQAIIQLNLGNHLLATFYIALLATYLVIFGLFFWGYTDFRKRVDK